MRTNTAQSQNAGIALVGSVCARTISERRVGKLDLDLDPKSAHSDQQATFEKELAFAAV